MTGRAAGRDFPWWVPSPPTFHTKGIEDTMQLCFAFNKDGLRCMQLAGHDGGHSHAIEWDDADCWTPGTPAPAVNGGPSLADSIGIPGDPLPTYTPPMELEDCVVCNHRKRQHTEDGCIAKNAEGDACGCFEFV